MADEPTDREIKAASALMLALERKAYFEAQQASNDGRFTMFFRGLTWRDVIPMVRAVLKSTEGARRDANV